MREKIVKIPAYELQAGDMVNTRKVVKAEYDERIDRIVVKYSDGYYAEFYDDELVWVW